MPSTPINFKPMPRVLGHVLVLIKRSVVAESEAGAVRCCSLHRSPVGSDLRDDDRGEIGSGWLLDREADLGRTGGLALRYRRYYSQRNRGGSRTVVSVGPGGGLFLWILKWFAISVVFVLIFAWPLAIAANIHRVWAWIVFIPVEVLWLMLLLKLASRAKRTSQQVTASPSTQTFEFHLQGMSMPVTYKPSMLPDRFPEEFVSDPESHVASLAELVCSVVVNWDVVGPDRQKVHLRPQDVANVPPILLRNVVADCMRHSRGSL